MNNKKVNTFSTIGSTFVALVLLSGWIFHDPVKDFTEHVPGMDNRPETPAITAETVDIGENFIVFEGTPSEIQGSWPRFRGTDFDNISKENIPLIGNWDDAGPNILWSIDLGEGHAGPVISNGRVYIMDYDEEERADILRCFSLDDGQEIWRRGYRVYIKRNHGMSRTIPAIKDKYVVTMGPKCHVMCVDADSGAFLWGIDLEKEYHTEFPLWYTGQCALIDDSLAIIAVGGSALMIAIHCETGEKIWETPNANGWEMSHSSIMPFTIQGQKMFVYCAIGGMVGISAEGESAGEILFETNLVNHNVIAPSPVYLGDGKILVTVGYGGGSILLKVEEEMGQWIVESLQKYAPVEGLASEQQTPIYYMDRLYAILPKDAGPLRNQLVCYHPDDCTKLLWSSGKSTRFGLGPYMIADGKFFILSDDGVLTIAKATTREYSQLAQAKILDGHDAWGPMAIVNGLLLARDSRRLVCVDLRLRS